MFQMPWQPGLAEENTRPEQNYSITIIGPSLGGSVLVFFLSKGEGVEMGHYLLVGPSHGT